MQKKNQDLSLAKATKLQVSTIVDRTDQLAKAMDEMSIKEAQLNKVQIELRKKGVEV